MKPRWPPGFLNLNKPRGVTSRDVVNRVVRLIGRGVKVGHAGTLDPLATGVLVVAIGAATRLVELVQDLPKVYRAVIRLGARSDTLDADGSIVETPGAVPPTEAALRQAITRQIGWIDQVPPQYSAVKVAGRRAYRLARSGQDIELAARPVRIDRIDLLSYEWPRVTAEIACGGGTYIRSIARDIGEEIGCGGLIESLERTRIGPFTIEGSLDPDSLTPESIRERLCPLTDALAVIPVVRLDLAQADRVLQGQTLDVSDLPGDNPPPGQVALLDDQGQLRALAWHDPDTGRLKPRKVFHSLD